jgi:hypothetical protein
VDGVKIPFRTTVMRDGKKAAEQRLQDSKLNPGVDESAYRKP